MNDFPIFFYAENLDKSILKDSEKLNAFLKNRKRKEADLIYLRSIDDFIFYQKTVLEKDIAELTTEDKLDDKIVKLKNEPVFIEKGAAVFPSVYLDSRNGSIYIKKGVQILPFSVIQGPCFIDEHVLIDTARIRPGCSIFKGCKIAGEIEESVFLENTNKHHDGFIGHSYVGTFVNFGAMSTNSDLKNNYSSVKLFQNKKWQDTNKMKVGAFIGDHSKLGIGSLINTGTIIGVGANLYFEKGLYPKYIPSFAWGSAYPFQKYRWNEFSTNTKKIMARRNKELTVENENILKSLYDNIKDTDYEVLD